MTGRWIVRVLIVVVVSIACWGGAAATAASVSTGSVRSRLVASGAPWVGTIESDSQRVYVFSDGGGAQCNDHWHSDLSFVVNRDTTVTGTGTMKLTSGPNCSGRLTNVIPTREIDVSVSGNRQKDGFTLVLGEVGYSPPAPAASWAGITTLVSTGLTATGPPLTIPTTGPCMAGGTVPTSYTLNSDSLSASSVFALKCGPCDPSLLLKSRDEFNRADQLFGEADKLMYKKQGEYDEWLQDEEKEFVGISAEKGTLVKVAEGTGKRVGLEKVTGKVLDFFEFDLGPVITAYWLAAEIEPRALDHDIDINEVLKLGNEGARTAKQAVADLKSELEQEPNCEERAKAQRAKEDLAAKKRAIVDKWQMTPGNLYWNPIRGEWETEGAALKAAEQILTDARKVQVAGGTAAVPKPRKLRITSAQARAALVYIDKALKLHKDADRRERKAVTRTFGFAKALRALLKRG